MGMTATDILTWQQQQQQGQQQRQQVSKQTAAVACRSADKIAT
jgi:hypothetical protein